jgi:hypothetical protein
MAGRGLYWCRRRRGYAACGPAVGPFPTSYSTQPIGTLYWQKALGHAAAWLKNGNFDWLSSLWCRSLRVDALNLVQSTSGRSPGVFHSWGS